MSRVASVLPRFIAAGALLSSASAYTGSSLSVPLLRTHLVGTLKTNLRHSASLDLARNFHGRQMRSGIDDDIDGLMQEFYMSGPVDGAQLRPENNVEPNLSCPGLLRKRNLAISAGLVTATALALPSVSHAAIPGATLISNAPFVSALLNRLTETGFYQAFSLVFLSEIGDKTFFIAGLLAMKTSRLVAYIGAMIALAGMTVISVLIGQIFHAVPAGIAQGIPLDDIAAVGAFTFFGIKTLKEAFDMDPEGGSVMDEELAEAEEAVEGSKTINQATAWAQIISTCGLVFAAEFGDRSFLSTIALSAAQNPVSVAVGAIAAHALATGIAVLGGSYIARYISERAIGFIGGTLFLVFAVTTALGIF